MPAERRGGLAGAEIVVNARAAMKQSVPYVHIQCSCSEVEAAKRRHCCSVEVWQALRCRYEVRLEVGCVDLR